MSRRFKGKPIEGLPARLPMGEEILWQSAPCWRSLARRIFRVRLVVVYFAILVFWRIGGSLAAGHSTLYALNSGVSSLLLAAVCIGLFSLFAWLISHSTTYTITNRRIVITYGMALPKSLNVPFARIEAADLLKHPDGVGDIVFRLQAKSRLSYLLLWPHVQAGRSGAQPVLRCLAAPEAAARLLMSGLNASLAPGEQADQISSAVPAAPAERGLSRARAA